MDIPTARVLKEDSWRIGVSQVYPSRIYYGDIGIAEGLEIDGRVTETLGTSSKFDKGEFKGYGNIKDKALDFKYQFISEWKYSPAVALGIMDPTGTQLYSSQYIVASKQIYPFDITLGFGNGALGKNSLSPSEDEKKLEMLNKPREWLNDSQFFYGLQLAPSEKYALMVEYSPVKYQSINNFQVNYVKKPATSKYNFGFRWKPLMWTDIDLSYQRGNQVGMNFSMTFDIGKPLIPLFDYPYKEELRQSSSSLANRLIKEEQRQSSSSLTNRLITALLNSGFSDIGVALEGNDLRIEAQNDKYYYNTKAMAVILKIVSDISPETVQNVNIVLIENGIPMMTFTTTREDINEWYSDRLTSNQFLYLSRYHTDISEPRDMNRYERRFINYGFKPSIQTFLNDPSGYFKYRVGLEAWSSYHPWKGASLVAGIEGYPLNNISTVNEPLSIPVRSDIVLYEKKNVDLERLMFDQIYKTAHEFYGRIAAGLLEIEYAGFDGEVAMPLFDGRLMVGLSGSTVKKRDPDNPFKLKSDEVKSYYTTAFLITRFNFPEKDVFIDLKTGRFLAGDVGTRISISKFINGVIVSAWYGITNTSVFSDTFNRGYRDKGISVIIPMRLFKGQDSKTSYYYSLAPWTRDVAQDIDHYNTLFDFIGRNNRTDFNRDAKEMTH